MPQGKGTYGSEVGRPSKKKYQVGGEVTDVAEVIAEAAQMGQEFPMSNAMERSENYQLGGQIQPPTAPSMPQYKEGGPVDVTDIVKATSERQRNKKAISEHLKKLKRTGRDTVKTAQGETRAAYWKKQQKYDQGALKETVKEQKKKILKGKK